MTLGRPNPRVLVADLDGQAVLLDLNSRDYFRLNETSVVIWRALERGEERDAIVASLVAQFEVDADEAGRALDALVVELRTMGLLTDA